MKMFLYSDIHYAPGLADERKLTGYAGELIGKLKKVIAKEKPDIIFNLGDLVQDFGEHEKDLRNFREVLNYFDFDVPHIILLGNHDLKALNNPGEILSLFGLPAASYGFDLFGYHFVVLGNYYVDENNKVVPSKAIADSDLEWLKKDLKNNKLPVICFSHYGLAEDKMEGSYWFSEKPSSALVANRDAVKEILADYDVLACINGHQHWTKQIIQKGRPYITVGSLTENINDDGKPDGAYAVVNLDGHDLAIRFGHLNID